MSKLPIISGKQCIKVLEKFGFVIYRQRGSHVTFVQSRELPITVPIRDGQVGRFYLGDICSRLDLDGDSRP